MTDMSINEKYKYLQCVFKTFPTDLLMSVNQCHIVVMCIVKTRAISLKIYPSMICSTYPVKCCSGTGASLKTQNYFYHRCPE